MKSVCVFLSSADGTPNIAKQTIALGREIAAQRSQLIYGGASIGLMGLLADSVLAAGGQVVGVIPESLVAKEVAHRGLTELHVVCNMHERKAKLFELADQFVVLPGGFGTLEEAFEILTGRQIGIHHKPIRFLDIDNFWQGLESFLQQALAAGVLRPQIMNLWQRVSTVEEALS
jgi:uncharacterized protein (TIGR00730 family)